MSNFFINRVLGNRANNYKSDFNKHGISISPSCDKRADRIDKYLAKDRGTLELSLLERDGDNAVYSVIFNSNKLDNPLKTEIEVRLRDEKVIDNPMETVNQATEFHKEVSQIIKQSSGRAYDIISGKEIGNKEPDYIDFEALSKKIHERVNIGLAHGFQVSNSYEKDNYKNDIKMSNPKLLETPRRSRSISLGM